MKDVIKKIPIPICGVMLGAAALGNLLQSYSEGIRSWQAYQEHFRWHL